MNPTNPPTRSSAFHLQLWLLLLVVFSCSGATCSRGIRNPFVPLGPPAPEVLLGGSSLDQVIGAVNQNASRIVSYQTNNAKITVPGMPGIPLLSGNIAALQPGKVRLRASTSLTGDEVDMGSNEQLFWFWVKRNEPPALYFCRHDQFAHSAARQVMPIEPQWLLDALGMMQFSPNDQHNGPFPRDNDTIEIQSTLQTPSGPMTKSTIIDARRAWVLEQHVYDATGTLIASSRAKNHRYIPEIGVSIPQDISLRVPAAELSLSIDVGDVQLNSLIDNPALWSLPAIAPQVDLGSAAPGTVAPIRSAGTHDLSTFASPTTFGIAPTQVSSLPNPQLATLPVNAMPTSAAPTITPAPVVPQPVHTNQQPITYGLQPGGVALPSNVR